MLSALIRIGLPCGLLLVGATRWKLANGIHATAAKHEQCRLPDSAPRRLAALRLTVLIGMGAIGTFAAAAFLRTQF